jgi:hypothetical protein
MLDEGELEIKNLSVRSETERGPGSGRFPDIRDLGSPRVSSPSPPAESDDDAWRKWMMIKHPASRSLCSSISPILLSHHHTLPTATSRFHFDQLQALPSTPQSRHNCEVSTPAERRAGHSRALTIVNRSTIEKVQRNHRYHSPDICSVVRGRLPGLIMDGSNEPLLGRSGDREQNGDARHPSEQGQGRSIDLPPLRPTAGFSRNSSVPPRDSSRMKNTAPNSEEDRDKAVGERGELLLIICRQRIFRHSAVWY